MSETTFLRTKDTNSVEASKDDIEILKTICEDAEVRKVIKNWLKSNGWIEYEFGDILGVTGIQLPVSLSNLNKKNYSFDCISIDGQSYTVELYSNNVCITNGNLTKCYEVSYNKDDLIPKVKLHFTQISDDLDKVKILNNYDQAEENSTLVIVDNQHTINIKLASTNPIFSKKINDYLASLTADSVDLFKVYATIINLFGAKECWNISIRYTENTEKSYKPQREESIFATKGSKGQYSNGNISVTLQSNGKYEFHIEGQNIDDFGNQVSLDNMEKMIQKVKDIMKVLK